MYVVVSPEERLRQVETNLRRFDFPRLREPLPEQSRKIMLAGFGPSLRRTWKEMRAHARERDVMTTSGAHDFLIARNIIPTYHVECDPREHKAFFLRRPHKRTKYLIASHCHPKLLEQLIGFDVTLWHGFSDDNVANQVKLIDALEPGAKLLSGGTNAGMRAVVVARHLGYTKFILHGMDCSYEGATLWAGEHSGRRHHTVKVRCNGRVFDTSDVMMTSTDDFFNTALISMRGCTFAIRGDGLLAERCKVFKQNPALALSDHWWEPIGFTVKRPKAALEVPPFDFATLDP